jgi:hypothetical protein
MLPYFLQEVLMAELASKVKQPIVTVLEESELSEDFVRVAETKDIQPSSMKAYGLAGEKVCIVIVHYLL